LEVTQSCGGRSLPRRQRLVGVYRTYPLKRLTPAITSIINSSTLTRGLGGPVFGHRILQF
jgi:hypothetical protein